MDSYISSKVIKEKRNDKNNFYYSNYILGQRRGIQLERGHVDAKILLIAHFLKIHKHIYIRTHQYRHTHTLRLFHKSLAILKLLMASKCEVILSFTNPRIIN